MLAIIALTSVCTVTLADERAPAFSLGDSWTYHFSVDEADRGNYVETVVAAEGGTVDLLTVDSQSRRSTTTYDGVLHRYLVRYALNPAGRRGRVLSDFSGNQAPIKFPLALNDEWTVLCHYDVSGNPITQEFRAKVVGREQIKTLAGEFDTYKIVLTGYWWSDDGLSYGKGRQIETYWYAPVTKRFVRREIKSYGLSVAHMWNSLGYSRADELVQFHLAP